MSKSSDATLLSPIGWTNQIHFIAEKCEARGEIRFEGELQWSGSFQGLIESTEPGSILHLKKTSKLSGHIKVGHLIVEGVLQDIHIEAYSVHFCRGAKVVGRIQCQKIVVEEGAMVEGRFVSERKAHSSGSEKPKELGRNP